MLKFSPALALLASWALALSVAAQPAPPMPGPFTSTIPFCWNGTALAACGTPGTSAPTQLAPTSGTPTQVAVSCGVTTTVLLAPGAATQFVLVKNPSTNPRVWVDFSGAAAVGAAPSFGMGADSTIAWTASGYLPTSQFNCISPTGAASLVLIYK